MLKYLTGLFALIWLSGSSAIGQQTFIITGKVVDENLHALPGAVVSITPSGKGTVSDINGYFALKNVLSGDYDLSVSFLGYKDFHQRISLKRHTDLLIQMVGEEIALHEVVVADVHDLQRIKEESLNLEIVSDEYLKQNQSGSLMQTLDRLGGVSSMNIGSGQSKPAIRGLGFNRVVVVENGLKHEGQQWGSDHGLEIDQYAANQVEIVKGPSSLRYGSDAIGGVIEVKQDQLPEQNMFTGTIDLSGKTNNNLLGTSIALGARKDKIFATFRATWLDYADYKVPTDSIDIYSYRAPLYKNHLRNTAGYERDFHFSFGYTKSRFQSRFYISNIYSKSGFFANAHGLEPRNVDTGLHDQSNRDIKYPYQQVNHFKVINKSKWEWSKFELKSELGFQRNFRQEWSQYVSHGYMPAVYTGGDGFAPELERQFDKYVYSVNAEGSYFKTELTSFSAGINAAYQDNAISGRGFILPAFRQISVGSFGLAKHAFNDKSMLQAGIRYDYGAIQIDHYNDWFTSPVIDGADTTYQYLQRAQDLSRNFSNISWSLGYSYNIEHWSLKANVGKSFRMPIAHELGANGVNYHHFSYEVGDPDLSPEVSYQLDAGAEFRTESLSVNITPFFNYFSNYIYLNPTSEHDRLYGNGNQVFYYSESEVLRYGGELNAHYQLLEPLSLGLIGEYVYARQLSGEKKGYTLPFSPPASVIFNIKYEKDHWKAFRNTYVSVDYKIAAAQIRLVPPEEVTNGYRVVNLGVGSSISTGERNLNFSLQVQNLLDTKYFNHTSFYRLINVPEPGRNFILSITVPFTKNLKQG